MLENSGYFHLMRSNGLLLYLPRSIYNYCFCQLLQITYDRLVLSYSSSSKRLSGDARIVNQVENLTICCLKPISLSDTFLESSHALYAQAALCFYKITELIPNNLIVKSFSHELSLEKCECLRMSRAWEVIAHL